MTPEFAYTMLRRMGAAFDAGSETQRKIWRMAPRRQDRS